MGGEEIGSPCLEALNRVADVHVLRRAVGDFQYFLIVADLFESACKSLGKSRELGGGRVGKQFTLTADRHLQQLCKDGCEDRKSDPDDEEDHRAVVLFASAAVPSHAAKAVGQQRN